MFFFDHSSTQDAMMYVLILDRKIRIKVHIFWEGHKILRNLPLTLDCMYCSQKLGENFAKFCGFLKIYDKKPWNTNLPELTRRQKVVGPLLNVADTDIKSGGDDTDFVQTTGQIDNNFAATVIVDFLEFADISVLHHNLKKCEIAVLYLCIAVIWHIFLFFTYYST